MKTQKSKVAQMDEIIFENRNKAYGAYILRKMYRRNLSRALFISVAILLAALAYPLVSSYNATNGRKTITVVVDGTIDKLDHPPIEPPELPNPPTSTEAWVKRVIFVAPTIVDGQVEGEIEFPAPDELTNKPINEPLDIQTGGTDKSPTETIEIPDETPPAIFVQEMPEFPGGDSERINFLAKNTAFPTMATQSNIQGTVYVQFVVDTKGNITDVKVLRGIGGGCDEEAIRVIKMMPQWHPGRQNGKPVRVLYNMGITFTIKGT